jgi:hypothetical protein
METMNTTTEAPPLSPADRCDRCGARALVRAVMPGGGDLFFCAHHGREHATRLREVAVEIHDHTGALVDGAEPSSGADDADGALAGDTDGAAPTDTDGAIPND